MTKTSIDYRIGIEICLNCPYDDCIGQSICPELAAVCTDKPDDILERIEKALERNGAMSVSEIVAQCNTYRSKVYGLINSGRLEVKIAGARKKSIVGVK